MYYLRSKIREDDPPSNTQQVPVHSASVNIGDIHYHHSIPASCDVNKAENDLRESLYGNIQLMTDLEESESLPIVVAKQSQPQHEFFGKRSWLNESSNEDNTIFYDMYKLFEESNKMSREQAQQQCVSQIGKEDFIRKTGNAVGASGIVGIGKTTMAKLIAKNINNDRPDQKPLIFFVSLRDIDVSKPCSVLQFLISSMLSDWDHTLESDKALLKRINQADDVYIFTDAMDEVCGMNLKAIVPQMTLYDIKTPDVIFKNLYSGRLLPKAKKLLTSRPEAFHDLHPDYKPQFSLVVLGLSKESQELLCHRICENADDAEKVKAMLASNPTLSSLCFIPMLCRMTVLYLLQNIESGIPFFSSSDLFTFVLNQFVRSNHFRGDVCDIQTLTKLALDGFFNDKFIFDVADLQAAGVAIATVDVFMNIDVVGEHRSRLRILEGDKRYYFSHLLWQGFFSAINLLFFSSNDQFYDLYHHFTKESWYSVVKFMFGLSNPLVLSKMQFLFHQISADDLSQKLDLLKSFLRSSLQHYYDTEVRSYPSLTSYVKASCFSEVLKFAFSTSHEKLFMICSWVHELQDVEVSQFIAELLPEQIPLRGSILPSDVTCLCHVLSHTQVTRRLSIGRYTQAVQFVGDSLKSILYNLHRSPHQVYRKLWIAWTPMYEKVYVIVLGQLVPLRNQAKGKYYRYASPYNTDDNPKSPRPYSVPCKFYNLLERLLLAGLEPVFDHQLPDEQAGFRLGRCLADRIVLLSDVIKRGFESRKKLEKLHIKNQVIDINDFTYILHDIEELSLHFCNLSLDDVQQIFQVLRQRQCPIKYLSLSGNRIVSSSIEDCVRSLPMIQGLELRSCNLSEYYIQQLANMIERLEMPMTNLNLSGNQIGRSGIESISRCILNIQCLVLSACELSGNDVETLAMKIAELNGPMMSLQLDQNNIGSSGVESLYRCIHKVQSLSLVGCNLTGDDVEMLMNKIRCLEQPMKLLNLGKNIIGSTGLRQLCRCLYKIQHLVIDECELTGEDMIELADAILQRHQPMDSLRIDGNKIGDNGAIAISRCLHKIKLLTLFGCNLSEVGIEAVRSTNARNEQKCEIFG